MTLRSNMTSAIALENSRQCSVPLPKDIFNLSDANTGPHHTLTQCMYVCHVYTCSYVQSTVAFVCMLKLTRSHVSQPLHCLEHNGHEDIRM